MNIVLDHLILPVNDRTRSIEFYERVLDFSHETDEGPFSLLRVNAEFAIVLAQWGTKGGEHLAFALPKPDFENVFARLRANDISWGDAYDQVGNLKGPGRERGARGIASTLYFFDPDRHLLEIRHYD